MLGIGELLLDAVAVLLESCCSLGVVGELLGVRELLLDIVRELLQCCWRAVVGVLLESCYSVCWLWSCG